MQLAGSKEGDWRMPERHAEGGMVRQADGSRRDFLVLAGVASSGTAIAQSPPAAAPQIGILLATTYTTGTLEARLDEAKAHGLTCVQVSMSSAGVPEMPDEMPAGLPARFHREAATRGIRIGSVQGTFNMCHPDAEHRRTGLRRLRVLAEAFPRMAIHICTGTRDQKSILEAPSGQQHAAGMARYGRVCSRGGRNRPAVQGCPCFRAGGEQHRGFSPEGTAASG